MKRLVVLVVTLALALGVASLPASGKPRPPGAGVKGGTTTTGPSTSTSVPSTGGDAVGYLGCAATHDAVQGAHESGSSSLWGNYGVGWTGERDDATTGGSSDLSPRAVFQRRYNQSSLGAWTDPTLPAWGDFDRALAAHPGTRLVWWQPCATDDWVGQGADPGVLDAILAELRRHWSGPIVVSATSDYGPVSPVCKSLPLDARLAVLDWIGDRGLHVGPDLPRLTSVQHLNRCHPNDLGRSQSWGPSIHGYGW